MSFEAPEPSVIISKLKGVQQKLAVGDSEALIVPFLAVAWVFDELSIFGEVLAEGDLWVE